VLPRFVITPPSVSGPITGPRLEGEPDLIKEAGAPASAFSFPVPRVRQGHSGVEWRDMDTAGGRGSAPYARGAAFRLLVCGGRVTPGCRFCFGRRVCLHQSINRWVARQGHPRVSRAATRSLFGPPDSASCAPVRALQAGTVAVAVGAPWV